MNQPSLPCLVGDLGGTNLRLALATPGLQPVLNLDSVRTYSIRDYPSFEDVVKDYLTAVAVPQAAGAALQGAVIAVAGRIDNGRVPLTNYDWVLAERDIARALGIPRVRLINDFAAVGQCLPLLTAADLDPLGRAVSPIRPTDADQVFCALGPGTGLGVSALCLSGRTPFQLATEGGHVSFAPHDEEEDAILACLRRRFGRVSVERLLCGSGLVNLYEALAQVHGLRAGDDMTAARITERASPGDDTLESRAVTRFCRMLGSVAGDYVLAYGAWHGVYIAGGMTRHLMPFLVNGSFRSAFECKGRFSEAVAQVPVALITHPQPGLLGAAAAAMRDAGCDLFDAGAQRYAA